MAEFVIIGTNNFLTRYLIVAGLFFLALLVLSASSREVSPLGRFSYGIAYLAVAAAQFVLPSAFLSMAENDVDFAAGTWLALTAVLMAILAHFSRRRSMDAYGSSGNAFMAAIPIISLILIFKRPIEKARIEARSKMALLGRIVAFSAFGVAVLFLASFFKVVLDGMNRNAVVNVRDMPIERAVRIQAALLEANVPQLVDAETMLTGAKSSGRELTLEYMLTGNSAAMNGSVFELIMGPIVSGNVCSDPLFRDLVNRGARIVFEYRALSEANGLQRYRLQTEASDC